jgi:hypothetical protein
MAERKRSPPKTLTLLTEQESPQPKRQATKLVECLDYVEAVNPAFDPKRVYSDVFSS